MKKLLYLCFLMMLTLLLTGCDGLPGITDLSGNTIDTGTSIQTTVEVTDIETTESIDEVNQTIYQIYELAVSSSAFTGTYEDWLETVRGPIGLPGEDGKEVLLQVSEGYIQWQHLGDTEWVNLVSIIDLTGTDGREVTFQVFEGYIQWQYVGDTTWTNLLELTLLAGADGLDGANGKEVTFQVADGFIQWQYIGDTTWINLINLDTLTGDAGTNGKEVAFQVADGFIQWQYVGEETWHNLIDLLTLAGSNGQDGLSAYEIYLLNNPNYEGDEVQWLNDLINGTLPNTDTYTISFESNGGTEFSSLIDVIHGSIVDLPMPEREGYTFSGWFLGNGINDMQFFNTSKVTSDLFLYARWQISTYIVQFVDYDGLILNTQEVKHGFSAVPPVNPYRKGFVFTGWDLDYSYITNDLVITAVYGEGSYILTFDTSGGGLIDSIYTDYGIEIDLPIPLREGYQFVGWYDNPEYTGTPVNVHDYSATESITLYAKWSLNSTEGGSFDSSINIGLNSLTNVNILTEGLYVYYSFTPIENGNYIIQSYSEFDTIGFIYNQDYDIIYENDDFIDQNFLINGYLEAGMTYYIVVALYDALEIGNFTIEVSRDNYTETELDILWQNAHYLFNEVWSDYLDEFSFNIEIVETEINGIPIKALTLQNEFLAVEAPEVSLEAILTYLNGTEIGMMSSYEIIPETNIIVSNVFSMNHILLFDVVNDEGIYYSADLTTLIRYSSNYEVFEIPEYVTHIGSLAFFDNDWLVSVYIPLTVTDIEFGAFMNAFSTPSYTIYTEYTELPIGWSEYAFNNVLDIVWNSTLELTIYSFESNGGSLVSIIETTILDYVEPPTKEGYIFAGWYDNALLEGNPIVFPYHSVEDITLYAKWIDPNFEGQSFETAINIVKDTLTPVNVYIEGGVMYYVFVPETTGLYRIYSLGEYDTVGYLYDSNFMMIDQNDDSFDLNFFINYELEAGLTYYIATHLYSDSYIGNYHIEVSEASNTQLDLIWETNKDLFFDIWGDSSELTASTIETELLYFYDVPAKALLLNGLILAIEVDDLFIYDVLEELQANYDFMINYRILEGTNIIVSDLFSFDLILLGDVTQANDHYFSTDMSTLIRYIGIANDYIVIESISKIGSFAFVDRLLMNTIQIPNTVQEIGYGAFMYEEGMSNLVVYTDYYTWPDGWSDFAFSPDIMIVWNNFVDDSTEILVDTMTSSNITEESRFVYYHFNPLVSGYYDIYSIGEFDTIAYLYDDTLSEIAFSDDYIDGNFLLSQYLETGHTYYIAVSFYDELEVGMFDIYIVANNYVETELDILWQNNNGLFYDIWGDFVNLSGFAIDIVQSDYYEYSVKAIVFDDMMMALEVNPEELDDILSALNDDFGFVTQYTQIENTNILVNKLLSFDLIIQSNIVNDNGNYFSSDMTRLVKFSDEFKYYQISDTVTSIGNFAFSMNVNMDMVYIPISVVEIDYAAFISYFIEQSLMIITEHDAAPGSWQESAFDIDQVIIWSASSASITYSFETNGGSVIDPYEGFVLVETAIPFKEGYTFLGWYDNINLEGSPIELPYYSEENITLYAKWFDGVVSGVSFETAFIMMGEMTPHPVGINSADQLVYFQFTPELSGYYSFYSMGTASTFAFLYNSAYELLEAEAGSFDNNFHLHYYLNAGETYYLTTGVYDFVEMEIYQIQYVYHESIESNLDILWYNNEPFFNEVWGDVIDNELYEPMISTTFINDVEVKALLINNVAVALEFTEENIALLPTVLAMNSAIAPLYFEQIPGTNILVLSYLSINHLFLNNIIYYEGNYYTQDMKTLIKYLSFDTVFVVPETVTSIVSYAFSASHWLEAIYLPDTVVNLETNSIHSFVGFEGLTVYTELTEAPVTWQSDAIDYYTTVVFNASGSSVIYSFETNGGSMIDSYSGVILEGVETPVKEGYKFIGWYDNELLEGLPIELPYYSDVNVTLYAEWIEIDFNGVSFSSAIPLTLETLETVNITIVGEEKYYQFTPEVSGMYIFESFGDFDTYGELYMFFDGSPVLLSHNDDYFNTSNFMISYDLIAGETYYLVTYFFDEYDYGMFDIHVRFAPVVESDLDRLWNTNDVLFNDVWNSSLELQYGDIEISMTNIDGYLVKVLTIYGTIMALECDSADILYFDNYLNNTYTVNEIFTQIEGTNVFATNLLSLDLILQGLITVNGGIYYSTDMTELVKYTTDGFTESYIIPDNITRIRHMAFFNTPGLYEIYIPIEVATIDYGGFNDTIYL